MEGLHPPWGDVSGDEVTEEEGSDDDGDGDGDCDDDDNDDDDGDRPDGEEDDDEHAVALEEAVVASADEATVGSKSSCDVKGSDTDAAAAAAAAADVGAAAPATPSIFAQVVEVGSHSP